MAKQDLQVEDVKRAGREAYDRKQLSAQADDPLNRDCFYETECGCRCIIGWALSDDTLTRVIEGRMNSGVEVKGLVDKGLIKVADDDLPALTELQEAHDLWCDFSRTNGEDAKRTIEARRAFLIAIDHPEVTGFAA
jgi:hypothetical protein